VIALAGPAAACSSHEQKVIANPPAPTTTSSTVQIISIGNPPPTYDIGVIANPFPGVSPATKP
jgi:hypothetical protein